MSKPNIVALLDGFFIGVIFIILLSLACKEKTVLYQDGYAVGSHAR